MPCSILDSHSVQLIKYTNEMPFLRPHLQVTQILINSHIQKHEVTRSSLLILYIFNMFSMT